MAVWRAILTKTGPVQDDPGLVKVLFPYFVPANEFSFITAAYLNLGKPVTLAGFIDQKPIDPQPIERIRPFLAMAAPKTFQEALFSIDFFQACLISGADPFGLWGDWNFEAEPKTDSLLTDSHGLLLWNQQLEALFARGGFGLEESRLLRKMVNAKRPQAFDMAEKVVLGPGLNLARLMDDRMAFRFVLAPNLAGAKALFRLITNHRTRSEDRT